MNSQTTSSLRSNRAPSEPEATKGPLKEVLSFTVREQVFALPVLSIQEVRSYERPLPLPHLPSTYQGVLNLRGEFVPVMDLGLRLGLSPFKQSPESIIVVAKCDGRTVGLAVDAVNDVRGYQDADIKSVRTSDDESISAYVSGMLPAGESLIQLLNFSEVMKAGSSVQQPPEPSKSGTAPHGAIATARVNTGLRE